MQFLRKRSFVIFITVSILAVLVGGYWYFYGYRPQQLLKSFQNEYKKGVDAQQAGDLNASIAAFNESLKNAPSDLAEVRRKINIASLEFRRNEGDDRVDAVKTYREILENSSLPASYRASAISRLMNFLDASRDEEFAKKEIFKGELLEPFLKEGDVWLAERRAYELSSQLSPSPTTAFLIAGWYNRQLLENKSLTQTAKTEYLAKLKEWTRKGESLLPLMASQNYSKSQAAFAYMLAGIEKGGIAQFFDRNYSPSEYAFKEALKFLERFFCQVQLRGDACGSVRWKTADRHTSSASTGNRSASASIPELSFFFLRVFRERKFACAQGLYCEEKNCPFKRAYARVQEFS